MPTTFDGKRGIANGQYAIVVSRYNDSITQRLLDGALESLQASGVADDDIQVAWVPGAW